MSDGTQLAPEGLTWVCAACGKTSRTKFGFDANNERVSDAGWDVSCMMSAVLCKPTGDDPPWEAVKQVLS